MDFRHRSLIPMVLALTMLAFAGAITAFAMAVDWSQLDDVPESADRADAGFSAAGAPAAGGSASTAAAGPLVGVQLHPLWAGVSPRDAARELDVARRGGARIVRIDVGWSSLESAGKGRISRGYSRRLDAFLRNAAA